MEIEECVQAFLRNVKPVNMVEKVHISEAYGRIAAGTLCAPCMVPAFPKSAMDGYAVRAADVAGASRECPVPLRVMGELCAGDYHEFAGVQGTCVRVMTGAYVPENYDTVVRQEDTDYGMETVAVYQSVPPYTNYCRVGEDMRQGDVVAERGDRITALHVGLLASLGMEWVPVYAPVRAALIATGSELTKLGTPLEKGKIYNSIAYMLSASIKKEGLCVVSSEICPDDRDKLISGMKRALEAADIVITTGGVSVGKKDLMPEVLDSLGADRLFSGANIQPGTPTIGSMVGEKPVLSLSGNPYAALANFEIYFWELAAAMMHSSSFRAKRERAELQSAYPKTNRLRRFIRARAEGGKVWIPSQVHASSVISNMVQCNCFIDLEAGRAVSVGDMVEIRYIK